MMCCVVLYSVLTVCVSALWYYVLGYNGHMALGCSDVIVIWVYGIGVLCVMC